MRVELAAHVGRGLPHVAATDAREDTPSMADAFHHPERMALVPIHHNESESEALGRHLLEQPADARPAVAVFYPAACDDDAGINA